MRSVYELTTLALRVWLVGFLIVSVVSLSDFVFRRPHGVGALLRRLAMGLVWPLALVSGAGRRVLLGQFRGVT